MIKIDRYFASGESIGIKYDDEDLAIDWKIDKKFVIKLSVIAFLIEVIKTVKDIVVNKGLPDNLYDYITLRRFL